VKPQQKMILEGSLSDIAFNFTFILKLQLLIQQRILIVYDGTQSSNYNLYLERTVIIDQIWAGESIIRKHDKLVQCVIPIMQHYSENRR
jgi:hypothetical protein